MTASSYPSKLLESAVNEFAKLPGIGKKTALRLVLHLLKQENEMVFKFADTIHHMKQEIMYCKSCHNISDSEICNICADSNRDHSLICVVESIRDVMAIESTQQFSGIYHVLGGVISPMDGIGPDELTIGPLVEKIQSGAVIEVINALAEMITQAEAGVNREIQLTI
jgi:recombination protein RecR